jgi:hypothetical protein
MPRAEAQDSSGGVLAGAKLEFFTTGTSSKLDSYSDATLSTPNANPVVADSAGRFADIFLKDTPYKVTLSDSDDVQIWSADPVRGVVRAKGADITSAATLVIGLDGDYFDVVGNTGPITAMTVAKGTKFTLQFDSTPTLTDGASIDLGGANITTAAGDRGLFYATAANTVILLSYLREGVEPLGSGRMIQRVVTTDGAVATGTTAMPDDDTIPQNTEGDEMMTRAITPKNTANRLLIVAVVNVAHTSSTTLTAALFQDSTAAAIAANQTRADTVDEPHQIVVTHEMAAGTTSSTTFKVRIGGNTGSTTTFNGQAGGRRMGGIGFSSIVITEIAA